MLMEAAILQPGGGIILTKLPKPVPGTGEVLIRVLVCGVCTSDMGIYRSGLPSETVLGHEVVGIVEELGDGVTDFTIGQRVTGAIMAGYAQYACAKAEYLIPVPASLADHEAIVEPFNCLISGLDRAGASSFEECVVIGAGYMGLALLSLLRSLGISRRTVMDLKPQTAKQALHFGATDYVLPDDPVPSVPLVFESAGSQGALTLAGQIVQRDGTLVIVGYHPCHRDIDMGGWNGKALTVINSFEYRKVVQLRNMRRALDLAQNGLLPQDKLFTHSFPLQEVDLAFQTHLNRPEGFIKSYIRIDQQ